MKYHSKYEIDPAFIEDGMIAWRTTGNGEYIFGVSGGKKYFIKRFAFGPRLPSKSLPKPVYDKYKKESSALEDKQKEINDRFKKGKLTYEKDHIVVEDDNFWDDETNMFVTVTRLVPDANEGYDYTAMSSGDFLKLCRELAVLLQKAHAAGVTHGDLKEKNFFFQRGTSGPVPYLIDFDLSYPSDYGVKKDAEGNPMFIESVPYSDGYQSPEIIAFNSADEDEKDASIITDKTDVFTLAIVFHRLWTNLFPTVAGDSGNVGEAVFRGETIKLEPKFDFTIGSKNENMFSTLMYWMLEKDVAKRPTAQQVLEAMDDALDVDDFVTMPGAVQKYDLTPHSLHKDSVCILDKDQLKAKGVKSFGRATRGGEYLYLVKTAEGEEALTVDELIEKGYAIAKSIAADDLWEEDAEFYQYVSFDEIEKKGVSSIQRRQVVTRKFYSVTYRSGTSISFSVRDLCREGIVTKKVIEIKEAETDDKPWPEHGTAYDLAKMAERRVVKVEKVIDDGAHKYRITSETADGPVVNVVKSGFMILMGYVK